nr:MAG TPA: hypothetical protein [Bacteriophage sp.]
MNFQRYFYLSLAADCPFLEFPAIKGVLHIILLL